MNAYTGPQLLRMLSSIFIVFVGLIFVIRGFSAKHFINEAEWSTVVEDLPKYEARFWDRVVAITFGLCVIILGVLLFPRS